MLGVVMAAGLALAARPPELVRPGEAQAYAAWLEDEARKAAGHYARKDCGGAQVRPLSSAPTQDAAIAQTRPDVYPYRETLAVAGCGAAGEQSLVVFRDGDGWRALPEAPGESAASLAEQREVLADVFRAVKSVSDKDASCSPRDKMLTAIVYDTRVTRRAAPGQPWSERWFMSVCQADYRIDIDFTPRAGGGADAAVRLAP